jgi:hypothetical protein
MSRERLSIQKINEVLSLKWASAWSNRANLRSCRTSHSKVSEYVQRAAATVLKWPLPEALDEQSLFSCFFPEDRRAIRQVVQALPEWEQVREELKKRNVTSRPWWVESRSLFGGPGI